MAQTRSGAILASANRLGLSTSEYIALVDGGNKWCCNCKQWHRAEEFGRDASRGDGTDPKCLRSRNALARARYVPKPRPMPGRSFVPARDGDRDQARRRVNHFVECGLIPHPNSLRCHDCGHQWKPGERRHEYDHYLGYAPENHESVQAVCTQCHAQREMRRRRAQ